MGKTSYQTNKDIILNRAKEKYKNKSMSKKNITDEQKQKDYQKNYQKEYRKNMTDEQKQKYREAKKDKKKNI